jgi:hypothetical protein
MVDGDQWQMGEVDVDGWERGPLSQCEKTARACGSRHACDTKGGRGCVMKVKVCRGRSVLLQHTWTTDVWPVEGEER